MTSPPQKPENALTSSKTATETGPGVVYVFEASSHSLKLTLVCEGKVSAVFIGSELKRNDADMQGTVFSTDKSIDRHYTEALPHATQAIIIRSILGILKTNHNDLLDFAVGAGYVFKQGGEFLSEPVVPISEDVLKELESVNHLAPLHNLYTMSCYYTFRTELPVLKHHAALIQTAPHSKLPMKACWPNASLPRNYRDASLGCLMFPGDGILTVYQAYEMAKSRLQEIRKLQIHWNIVVCNADPGGVIKSVTAISDGRVVDTAKTDVLNLLWPGSSDPAMIPIAADHLNKKLKRVWQDLDNEQQQLFNSGSDRSAWAYESDTTLIDAYVYQLAKQVAGCALGLSGPMDALVFCSPVEEVMSSVSAEVRQRCVSHLQNIIPFDLEEERNRKLGVESKGVLTADSAWPLVLHLSSATGLEPEAVAQADLVLSIKPQKNEEPPTPPKEPLQQQRPSAVYEGPLANKVSDYLLSVLALD